jgi:hypothetical protein
MSSSKYFPIKFLILAFLFAGCCQSKINIVGADKDIHGCIGSAGYQWSEIKKECIRSFELTLQLLNTDKTSFTSILFSADNKQAEVFSKEGHFILELENPLLYKCSKKGNIFMLINNDREWEFSDTKKHFIYYQAR